MVLFLLWRINMFEKVPYGVKVRVRGNEKDGFIAEYAIHASRFFTLFDAWSIIKHYPSANSRYSEDTFPTLELAKEAAMIQYNRWINHFERDEEEKKVAKSQRKIVWKHP
jgi:hypothetical protein